MQLMLITAVQPSAYNPRTADAARLDLVELSLRKLGFLLPIYATKEGEILSGHQRHYVATRMGWTHIPVEHMKPMNLDERKAVNIVFNRATNDMLANSVAKDFNRELDKRNVLELGKLLPDKEGDDRYPVLKAQPLSVKTLVDANQGEWLDYARNLSRTLGKRGVVMPMVVRRSDLRVVNGIGRLQYLAERKADTAQVVLLNDAEAEFADAMLNYLSMDFDIDGRYADILRHNSFRRVRGRRTKLGTGMVLPMGVKYNSQFDIHDEVHRNLWVGKCGNVILDFGAGRMEDVGMLREHGIDADAFEPYVMEFDSDQIDIQRARQVARDFLGKVGAGKTWQTIFLQAVLNSVPFHDDRRKVIAIIASLCTPQTVFLTYTSAAASSKVKSIRTGKGLDEHDSEGIRFLLGYEPNIILGEFATKPKVQKFFSNAELQALLGEFFADVRVRNPASNLIAAECRQPRAVSKALLRSALELEFNLPYPNEETMGLVGEALAAFSQRLGVRL